MSETLIIGHRGTITQPENTMRAFLTAFKAGADGIELDVQKTLDGKLVVSHDSNLIRLLGIDFSIRGNTFHELQKHTIKGETIPLLEEVLSLVQSESKFVDIEVKNCVDFPDVLGLTKCFPKLDFIVSSFQHNAIRDAMKSYKKCRYAYIYCHVPASLQQFSTEIDFLKPEATFVDIQTYRGFERKTIPWVVNDTKMFNEMKNAGMFGVITDLPQLLTGASTIAGNSLLSIFASMIVKESIRKRFNTLQFDLRNTVRDIYIERITAKGGLIRVKGATLPLLFRVADKISLSLVLFSPSMVISIKTREAGTLQFKLDELSKMLK